MSRFTPHTIETAPAASKPILEATQKAWQMIPNLHAMLAESPAALEGYATLFDIFERSSFTPQERQVVYLTANYWNECGYCMAGHSVLAKMAGLPPNEIEALREGHPLADPKLQVLRRFTETVVTKRGFVEDAEVAAFLAAGYTKAQVLEVILGVAVKTLSNYTNHIVETPLDPFMKNTAWAHPARRPTPALARVL